MKKFKKIIALGCAAVMAVSAMSISAFAAENSFQTSILGDTVEAVPYSLIGSINNGTVKAVLQMPVDEYDYVSVEVQPVSGGTMLLDEELHSDTVEFTGIELSEGYYLDITTVLGSNKTVYSTDFSMYQQYNENKTALSDNLKVFSGDVICASAPIDVDPGVIEQSILNARTEHIKSLNNAVMTMSSLSELIDGKMTYGTLKTSEDVDSYTYTVTKSYVNFYLGMKKIDVGNTYGLTVLDSSGNVIYMSGTKGRIPFEVSGGDADDVNNCYFPVNTKLTIEIDGKNGSCDPTANYEVKAKGYRTRYTG